MPNRLQEQESLFWTGIKYSVLIYFNLLILPFTIVLALSRLVSSASSVLRPIYIDVPLLDQESDQDERAASPLGAPTTPRSSGEWEVFEWQERLPLYRKKRTEWSQPLFWEDDDGYNLCSRRAASMSSIREE